jgi:hypothetical protein
VTDAIPGELSAVRENRPARVIVLALFKGIVAARNETIGGAGMNQHNNPITSMKP